MRLAIFINNVILKSLLKNSRAVSAGLVVQQRFAARFIANNQN